MKLYLSSFRNGNKPEELLKLLDGKKRTAVIFNAIDSFVGEERESRVLEEMDRLRTLDLDVHEVDLRNYFGKTDELKKELESYNLIWIRGGNIFILRRAFRQSGADKILPSLLRSESVVYGGYSAGVDILQPHLHGIEQVDDPNLTAEGYDEDIIWECLGLLPYCVAPHYKSDHPESADIDKTVEYYIENHIPFIALKDGQAIVIDGDTQKIVE